MDQNQARETAHRPLDGIRVVEMAWLAPFPYCGMILADFGAEVVVLDRPAEGRPEIPNLMERNPFYRGKRFIRVNLKSPEGVGIVKKMMEQYDVLIEPYRLGVMESFGLGLAPSHTGVGLYPDPRAKVIAFGFSSYLMFLATR